MVLKSLIMPGIWCRSSLEVRNVQNGTNLDDSDEFQMNSSWISVMAIVTDLSNFD